MLNLIFYVFRETVHSNFSINLKMCILQNEYIKKLTKNVVLTQFVSKLLIFFSIIFFSKLTFTKLIY